MKDAPLGLTNLSMPDLEALLNAVRRGQLAAPLTEAGLVGQGLGAQAARLAEMFRGLSGDAVATVIQAAISERVHRQPPHLTLVWTGPESRQSEARDTAIVVRQLFEQARKSVLVGGFAFDHGEEILRPLHAGMRDHGVTATFFLDIKQPSEATGVDAEAFATDYLDRFFRRNWPFGDPRPEIYYDPRTAVVGPPWVSLHAKVIVIDAKRTLVTSANFTDRGQTRNIEAGVLIDDPDFAERLEGHFRSLVPSGHVKRYEG
jgi:phosphatidylserine/phosphatidylglycerophosphate/cardiolipin synthase-like enzyme